jgi:ankyrin repeat protein
MPADESELWELLRAVARGDAPLTSRLLSANPGLSSGRLRHGASRQAASDFFLADIGHYLYAGDTPLHVAAAGHRPELARMLVPAGAEVSARNRRGAQPLHYAADGLPGGRHWNPAGQAATIGYLVAAGADPNAVDRSGVTPLHRAVRTRCAAAVGALLEAGADAELPNKRGSTPMKLATQPTGRGGSGTPPAIAEQATIVQLLLRHGATG